MKKCINNFILIIVLFSSGTFLYAIPPIPPVVYVAGDGSGDYNCNGSDDQDKINDAIDFVSKNIRFTTVYLKGKYTYRIKNSINIPEGTEITIATNAKVESPKSPIIYVAGDGSGDYNCDGQSDQEEINAALDFVAENPEFTTVYLKGGYTYWIDEPIVISSNTKLAGDETAKVQLIDNAPWPVNKPMIRQKGPERWKESLVNAIYGTENDSITNSEICGFEISGGVNYDKPIGSWYLILMIFYTASDLKVHDMNLHDSRGDIIRIMSQAPGIMKNIKIYNNYMENSGHEGVYFAFVTDVEVYNNKIRITNTNCGIRLSQCSNISIYGNTIGNNLTTVASGYAGVLLENGGILIGTCEIYNNFIYGKCPGIAIESTYPDKNLKDVHIHHNRIYRAFNNTACSVQYCNGGIHLHGTHNTIIEFNTIESSYKDGIVYEVDSGNETGYQTIVRNNIIANSSGYGINNLATSQHSFICEYNDVYNSQQGNYNNASSTSDIHLAPSFLMSTGTVSDIINLHLKSEYGSWNGLSWTNSAITSPCIDQGDPLLDFSKEPLPNGGRVNLGAYGNTITASKSSM